MNTPKLTKEDVRLVAKSIKKKLTAKQVAQVLVIYPFEQKQDPKATWNLVTEHCIHQVVDND